MAVENIGDRDLLKLSELRGRDLGGGQYPLFVDSSSPRGSFVGLLFLLFSFNMIHLQSRLNEIFLGVPDQRSFGPHLLMAEQSSPRRKASGSTQEPIFGGLDPHKNHSKAGH